MYIFIPLPQEILCGERPPLLNHEWERGGFQLGDELLGVLLLGQEADCIIPNSLEIPKSIVEGGREGGWEGCEKEGEGWSLQGVEAFRSFPQSGGGEWGEWVGPAFRNHFCIFLLPLPPK